MPRLDKKTKEVLRDAGRELAVAHLESAITTAEDSHQMHCQVRTLCNMSVHILATNLYNIERQNNTNAETALQILMADIRTELNMLRDCKPDELQLSKTKDGI